MLCVQDAWISRHACLALKSAAGILVPGNAVTAGATAQSTSAGAAQLAAAAGEASSLSKDLLQVWVASAQPEPIVTVRKACHRFQQL
jgi:hypothetical protein